MLFSRTQYGDSTTQLRQLNQGQHPWWCRGTTVLRHAFRRKVVGSCAWCACHSVGHCLTLLICRVKCNGASNQNDDDNMPDLQARGLAMVGVGHWLGTGAVAPKDHQFLQFKKALLHARSLTLKSQAEWQACHCPLQPTQNLHARRVARHEALAGHDYNDHLNAKGPRPRNMLQH